MRLYLGIAVAVAMAAVAATAVTGPKFYPDDPLLREPPPLDASGVLRRKLSDYWNFTENTFGHPGDRSRIPAGGVNTLGEPMDGAWYTHRHYYKRMSPEELALGPGGKTPPASGVWTIVAVKSEGISPGFTIVDSANRKYFVKLDLSDYMEMATAADVVSSRFFYAFGYHVPDQYLVYFDPAQLVIGKDVKFFDEIGRTREFRRYDLMDILDKSGTYRNGKYRAMASRAIPGEGIGPFRFNGQRRDDPNDLVPHEHRRDLRGLYVFCAWISHADSKALNTYDTLVPAQDGVNYIRHYLIDFGSTMGSGTIAPRPARSGHEPLFAWTPALRNFFTLGLYLPEWLRHPYPDYPSVGIFSAVEFNPDKWVPEYPNPAFENRLPDDDFWGAKQVMAFTDDDIRTIVHTGQYSDPKAEEYLVRTLIQRRDIIGRTFIERVLPLDRFEARNGRLVFDDLGVKYGLVPSRDLMVAWSGFNNASGERTRTALDGAGQHAPVDGAAGFAIPAGRGEYWVADISQAGDERRTVSVYIRKRGTDAQVVGIERRW